MNKREILDRGRTHLMELYFYVFFVTKDTKTDFDVDMKEQFGHRCKRYAWEMNSFFTFGVRERTISKFNQILW